MESAVRPTRAQMTWAQRLRRVFDIDVSRCSGCSAPLRVLAVITDAGVIAAILAHLQLPTARAPRDVTAEQLHWRCAPEARQGQVRLRLRLVNRSASMM